MPNPPKPTALKIATGNPGGRPLNMNEPKAATGEPTLPADLSKAAKKVWRQTVPVLLKLGTLTTADGDALSAYCEAKVTWRIAQKSIEKDGITIQSSQGLKKNPACTISNEAMKTMRALMSEFGMTPASRTKIEVYTPDTESPLSKLLNERNRIRSAGKPACPSS
jgi:P27 family predicted phage terminase small subunit